MPYPLRPTGASDDVSKRAWGKLRAVRDVVVAEGGGGTVVQRGVGRRTPRSCDLKCQCPTAIGQRSPAQRYTSNQRCRKWRQG
jgi:hypothetical protein